MKARKTCSVLVVDDDADIRFTVKDVLEAEGYSIIMAAHGAIALELLHEYTPQVILLDLSMPTMDGAQFRAAQRVDPSLSAIPIVVMTAAARVQERAAPLEPAAILAKPVQLEDLLAVVERFAGKVRRQ